MIKRTLLTTAFALTIATAPATAGTRFLSLLTAENNEAQALTFILANQLQSTGNQVEIVLCGPAGDVALATPPQGALAPVTPQGLSVRMLAERFIAQGGKLNVCAIYLPNRKLSPEALMNGVAPTQPKDVAATMADPAVKVVGQ
jgi:predicted peroxiredoxin